MTTVKSLKELDKVKDQVPVAEIKDPAVANFLAAHQIDSVRMNIESQLDEREYFYGVKCEFKKKQKELKGKISAAIKELDNHPDLLMLKAESQALHKRAFNTKKEDGVTIPQVPVGGKISQEYNDYNELVTEELYQYLYGERVAPLITELEILEADYKAKLDQAEALAAAEDREWKAGRQAND